MDSSGSSKSRKGLRKLMDKLTVSRSLSRSRSPSQQSESDPKILTSSSEVAQDTQLTSIVGLVTLPIDFLTVGFQVTGPSTGSIRTGFEAPTVVEPTYENNPSTRLDIRNDSKSHRASASETSVSVFNPSEAGEPARSAAWDTLRTSLRFLYESSDILPALSSAVGVLLSCVDGLEVSYLVRRCLP